MSRGGGMRVGHGVGFLNTERRGMKQVLNESRKKENGGIQSLNDVGKLGKPD